MKSMLKSGIHHRDIKINIKVEIHAEYGNGFSFIFQLSIFLWWISCLAWILCGQWLSILSSTWILIFNK